MGYRSNVVIGIHKTILARHLITNEIPKDLYESGYKVHEEAVYFLLNNWKWYDAYPEVAAIEAWFQKLINEQDALPPEAEVPNLFGAVRTGDDEEDMQKWGNPFMFDININICIDYPTSIQETYASPHL